MTAMNASGLDPCSNFEQIAGSPWRTYRRRAQQHLLDKSGRELSAGKSRTSLLPDLRIAVLIGSLLRIPYPTKRLDDLFLETTGLEWSLFIATAHGGMPDACLHKICALEHLMALSFVDTNPASYAAESMFAYEGLNRSMSFEEVSAGVKGGSIRQFFKLARAFELMQAHEKEAGWHFDYVLKTRTDILIHPPLDISKFQHLRSRAIYAVSDVVFFCNREVAKDLFTDLLAALLSLVSTDALVLPVNADQLLQSELEDVDFFLLNLPNFPLSIQQQPSLRRVMDQCIPQGPVGRRIAPSTIRWFRKHLLQLRDQLGQSSSEVARLQAQYGFCTGAWWYNSSVVESRRSYQGVVGSKLGLPGAKGSLESSKAWFYIIHMQQPMIIFRRWPSGNFARVGQVYLHPLRHFAYCQK